MRVIALFSYNADQHIHFGRMWQGSPLIADCVRVKIVDALLTLTLITFKQMSDTQKLYTMNRIHIIEIHHCVLKYYRMHQEAWLPLNFWSTDVHAIWVRDDVGKLQSCAFGRKLTACRTFHQFLVNIVRLPHLFSSSSFFSISMTYHMQCEISQPCTWSLCGELCSWKHG